MEKILGERESLRFTPVYPVAPEKVWNAWTDPQALRILWNQTESPDWLADLDVRVGRRGAFKQLGQLLH